MTEPNNNDTGHLLSSLLAMMGGGGNAGLPVLSAQRQEPSAMPASAGSIFHQMQIPGNGMLQGAAMPSAPMPQPPQQQIPPSQHELDSKSLARVEKDMNFNEFILNSKKTREAIAKRGSRVIACRARGQPMNHSFNVSLI